MAKNVICLWYDGTAEEAARFYAQTFPDSAVTAVHHAPGDYPDGKQGQVLTVEFTVLGSALPRPQWRPGVQAQRSLFVSDRHRGPGRDRPLLERHRRQRRHRERMRVVQGQMGLVLADHPAGADWKQRPIPTVRPRSARSRR